MCTASGSFGIEGDRLRKEAKETSVFDLDLDLDLGYRASLECYTTHPQQARGRDDQIRIMLDVLESLQLLYIVGGVIWGFKTIV